MTVSRAGNGVIDLPWAPVLWPIMDWGLCARGVGKENAIHDSCQIFWTNIVQFYWRLKQMSGWIFSLAYSAVLSEIESALEYSDQIPADVWALIETDLVLAGYLKPGYSDYISNADNYEALYRKAFELLERARALIPQDARQEVKLKQEKTRSTRQGKTGKKMMTFQEWSSKRLK
jgi:hypothetical protein